MHDFRKYVQEQMDARDWSQSQLANAAGIDRQVVNAIVNDTRDHLPQMPKPATVDGLAKAFGTGREKVLAHVAIAMGLPVKLERADVVEATDDELVRELTRRLKKAGEDNASTPPTRAAGSAAPEEERLAADFIAHKQRLRADPAPGDPEFEAFLEQQAAKHGPNRGKAFKQQQDDDAE